MSASPRPPPSLVGLLLLALTACERTERAQQSSAGGARHLLLVTIDTLRADRLGLHGHTRPTSPNLDRFAESAVVLENVQATSSWTPPALGSIMTGLYPSTHGCTNLDAPLHESLETLAEILQAQGFRTGGFSGHLVAGERFGFHQGFERFETQPILGVPLEAEDRRGEAYAVTSSPWLAKRADAWLAERGKAADGRWFLWLHFFDPHTAYVPHPGLTEQFLEGAPATESELRHYEAEIAWTDYHLGLVLERLSELGFADETLVVVVADHGEEFGDHGGREHGKTLYEEVTRVPCLVRAPGIGPGRVPDLVSQVDLLPTMLELLGCDVPGSPAGRSLAGRLRGGELEERAVHAELEVQPVGGRLASLTTGRWKLILDETSGVTCLYDLVVDPGERQDRSRREPGVARELEWSLRTRLEEARRSGAGLRAERLELSAEELEHLRALGYAGAGER